MDLETIAAYIDGSLPPARMAEVAEHLARSPDDYQVFADAVALKVALSQPDEAGIAARPGAARDERPRPRGWIYAGAASAAAVAILLVSQVLESGTGPPLFLTAEELNLRGSGSLASRLGEDWANPPWSQSRGPAASSVDAQESFRAGALSFVLRLAADAGDPAGIDAAAAELNRALSAAAAGPAKSRVAEIAADASEAANLERDVRPVIASLRELYDARWFDLGSWAEQARLASISRERGFFETDAMDYVRALRAGIAAEDPSNRALPFLDKLLREIEAASPSFDPATFRPAVDSLFAAAG